MEISDIVINFGSTAIMECAYSRIPVINFNIKPKLLFDFLTPPLKLVFFL